MKSALRLTLSSVGNPDFGQDPCRPVSPSRSIEVKTLTAAAAAVRDYIEHYRLGGGNFSSVRVLDGNTVVARISYNGRIWLPPESGWNEGDPEDWMRWRPMKDQ